MSSYSDLNPIINLSKCIIIRQFIALDVPNSAVVLSCQAATTNLCFEIANFMIDATKQEEQPIRHNNPAMMMYMVFLIIVCGYFVLNMIVGVVIDEFSKAKVQRRRRIGLF